MTNHDQAHASYIDRYPEPLPGGRAVMRVDTVFEGQLVESHLEGSPAPMATVAAAAGRQPLGMGLRADVAGYDEQPFDEDLAP